MAKLHRYKLLILKKWWVALLGAVAGVGGGWAVAHFGPPSYASVGRMIVNIKLSIPEGSVYSEEMSSFLGTQSALMQSGAVLNRAQTRLSVERAELPPRQVKVRVNVVPRTTIFVLQATGDDPQYTEAFLQACMEEYIQVKREMRTQTSDTTVAGLTEEILRIEKELRRAEDDLVAFQSTNSVVLLQDQGNSAANYLNNLNQRLAMLKSEHSLLETMTLDQNLERHQPAVGLVSEAGRQVEIDSDYLKAKQQIFLLKAEQQELGQFLRPKHPKMIAMSEEIARRERLLEVFRQQTADQLETRKSSLRLQIENLEREVGQWDAKTLEISRKSAEYRKLRDNSQRIQGLYDRLLATMQTLDVNKEISPETVTIMEKASPAFADRPPLSERLLMGALLGLAGAITLLLLADRLDDRMNSLVEAQQAFDEEILGHIPRERTLQRNGKASLVKPDDNRHRLLESYRNLRSSILYMGEDGKKPKTIVVTSSNPGEGKSVTASNLALTLAGAGSRVLLVDADVRKGGLHRLFGTEERPGVHEALAGAVPWSETVRNTHVATLSFIPRGRASGNAGELFVSKNTDAFLRGAAEGYDYVILDTAPVMAADDVTSLAPRVDGVIFIIRAEETSARVAQAALDQLYQRQASVLGIVFNAVRPNNVDYQHYQYKDYYRPYPEGTGREAQDANA